jgi:hypothetical protein
MPTPWDYPPELRNALATLEAHWQSNPNPFYAWATVRVCLLWKDAEGRLTGPHQPPLWCLLYLAKCSQRIMGIVELDPLPKGNELQRKIAEALDLTSNGRNSLKEWSSENSRMVEAFTFDWAREKGASHDEAYSLLASGYESETDEPKSKRRTQRDRVTKGRRLLSRVLSSHRTVH